MTNTFGGWRKSSYSGADNDCVEVAFTPDTVELSAHVRDSKGSSVRQLTIPAGNWFGFTTYIRMSDRLGG